MLILPQCLDFRPKGFVDLDEDVIHAGVNVGRAAHRNLLKQIRVSFHKRSIVSKRATGPRTPWLKPRPAPYRVATVDNRPSPCVGMGRLPRLAFLDIPIRSRRGTPSMFRS